MLVMTSQSHFKFNISIHNFQMLIRPSSSFYKHKRNTSLLPTKNFWEENSVSILLGRGS